MRRNLLIVDDSATTRAFIRRTIGMVGLETDVVHEAGDGAAALGLLAHHPVDLVVADLHMPVMDGVELVRRMQLDTAMRSIPVLVVSAEPDAERLRQLQEAGVAGCVRKPFTPEVFGAAISQIFGGAHA